MNKTLKKVRRLIGKRKKALLPDHSYDDLADDDIPVKDILAGISTAVEVEDYPDYPQGPCVLVLQKDSQGKPIHVLWGIPAGASSPAVLVTAYRPDPKMWSKDNMRRRE